MTAAVSGAAAPVTALPVRDSNASMVLAALDGLKQLTTVEEIARERGVEVSSLGYRSRAKVREAQLG